MSILTQCRLFRQLSAEWCARLEQGGELSEVADGVRIFTLGDASDSVYAIVGGEGAVRVGANDANGKMLMVELFRVGDLFGEIGVIDGGLRTADAAAQGRVRLFRISAATFLEVLERAPGLGLQLSRTLAGRLRRTFVLFQDATFEALDLRFARQLVYLMTAHGHRSPQGIRLMGRFRQSDLADLLGTTPRSIITILNAWRASGLVLYDAQRGWLTVVDEARLRAIIATTDA